MVIIPLAEKCRQMSLSSEYIMGIEIKIPQQTYKKCS